MFLGVLEFAFYFGIATDLPLGVTSSSPSLEERRLLPVHHPKDRLLAALVK